MKKLTNSAPSVPPTLKFSPWNFERSVLSAPTISLKKLLFEQWIKKWCHKVNPSACTLHCTLNSWSMPDCQWYFNDNLQKFFLKFVILPPLFQNELFSFLIKILPLLFQEIWPIMHSVSHICYNWRINTPSCVLILCIFITLFYILKWFLLLWWNILLL